MSLPHDVTRCDGNGCHIKHTCQRNQDKNIGPRTPHMTAQAPTDNCAFFIPIVLASSVAKIGD